jgi:hypothetical protein
MTNLSETSGLVRSQTDNIDRTITEIVGIARTQAGNVDVLATRTLQRADVIADTLQHVVLSPVRHVTALIEGVAACLGDFIGGRKICRDKPIPTDNIFV